MSPDHLAHMANQIAQFHAALPDPAEAREGVFTHLRRFWEPRMRTAIYQWIDEHGTDTLHPLAKEVLMARRAELEPRPRQKAG